MTLLEAAQNVYYAWMGGTVNNIREAMNDLDGNFIAQYDNAAEASRATGICARNIKQVAGKEEFSKGYVRKQAGGFIWEQASR
jgi:hypothetical protein